MNIYSFVYRGLAEILYDALTPDPFYITLEKSVNGSLDIKREAMLKYMDYSMKEAESYGKLYIPEVHDYGVSIWSKPIEEGKTLEKKSRKIQFLADYLGTEALGNYKSIVEFMDQNATKVLPDRTWYLSIVGIKPSHQNKGLGAGLIEPILVETDKQDIATYLETFTPRNMNFYQRLGYRNIDSFHEPITNARYWIMLREPR